MENMWKLDALMTKNNELMAVSDGRSPNFPTQQIKTEKRF